MSRYFFHLCAPDQRFRDSIGADVCNLADAHGRAVKLAERVMMFGGLADSEPDLRRWMVEIEDDFQRPIMTVVFPAHFVVEKREAASGARALLERLTLRWEQTTPTRPPAVQGRRSIRATRAMPLRR